MLKTASSALLKDVSWSTARWQHRWHGRCGWGATTQVLASFGSRTSHAGSYGSALAARAAGAAIQAAPRHDELPSIALGKVGACACLLSAPPPSCNPPATPAPTPPTSSTTQRCSPRP
jgi:hypothetical protein